MQALLLITSIFSVQNKVLASTTNFRPLSDHVQRSTEAASAKVGDVYVDRATGTVAVSLNVGTNLSTAAAAALAIASLISHFGETPISHSSTMLKL
jgi:hypothetical protein